MWGRSQDKTPEQPKESPKEDGAKTFDPEKLPAREKLPKALQNIVDKSDREDNFFDELVDGYAPESTESNVRYAAYATRIRTILMSAHRYVAYTSDIGESFRPVAHPALVRSAYGISWLYILGDVSYEGYKAEDYGTAGCRIGCYCPSSEVVPGGKIAPLDDYRTVMIQRGIFQSIASMGLPAFTIHSVVLGRALKDVKNTKVRTWGPIGLGLAVVPFLPSLFDEPVENAVEWIFHKGFETYGGKAFVGDAPATGREDLLAKRPKEKEL
ncbi:hypothetical protein ColKHC_09190 [Colletotrichum higginsianum]|nr:hypothetical protein ColKHC_09190 [Colletotrichum higginsianum]